jgi:hypothetical protein
VAARHGGDGILACTNHFRSDELAMFKFCSRYPKLVQCRKADRLDVADVAKKMNEVSVNFANLRTVQTMVFEPATLKLHLAIGSCPSSALPMKLLELKSLLKPDP